jgi:hypothetical protein
MSHYKSLVDLVAGFLKREFPDGPPQHITNKQIVQMVEKSTIGTTVSTKTVSRARKKLLSDGTN